MTRGRKPVDLTGQRFGRLTVTDRAPTRVDRRGARWACVCDCGESRVIAADTLKRGQSQSCGCLRREMRAAVNRERPSS